MMSCTPLTMPRGVMPCSGVELDLLIAPSLGLIQGPLHGAGHPVGVQDGASVEVAGGAADGLDQGVVGSQETFLVGIQDGHQGDLRHVQAFTQQVDAHQYVEPAKPQVTDDLRALHRLDIRVQVAHPHIVVMQVVGQVLGHALGQHRDQHPLIASDAQVDLREHIVDLGAHRAHLHLGIDQAGGPDHLLHHLGGVGFFIASRGWPRRRSSAAPSAPTPRTSAAGCPAPRAGGTRIPPGSPCVSGRPCTWRPAAGWSDGFHR